MLIIGDNGYIGTNLKQRLNSFKVFNRRISSYSLPKLISESNIIIHLAAKQRVTNIKEFDENLNLTKTIVDEISKYNGKKLIFASSVLAKGDTIFGKTKLKEEQYIQNNLAKKYYNILRIPNTYGPYAKPNYNNFFSTFSYNLWRDLPITINKPSQEVSLVYIGEIIDAIINCIGNDDSEIIEFHNLEHWNLIHILNELMLYKYGKHSKLSNNMKTSFMHYKDVSI